MMVGRWRIAAGLVVLAVSIAACKGDGPQPSGPSAVVIDAVYKAGAKDIAGLRALSCAGQEDTIRSLVGLPSSVTGALLPGVDLQTVIDAVTIDTSDVKVGDAVVTGDTAEVPVTGSVRVTFIATAMRPIVEKLMADRGTPMSSPQLDALLQGLQDYGQDVPLNQEVRLVREAGTWKVCQASLGPPSSAGSSSP